MLWADSTFHHSSLNRSHLPAQDFESCVRGEPPLNEQVITDVEAIAPQGIRVLRVQPTLRAVTAGPVEVIDPALIVLNPR